METVTVSVRPQVLYLIGFHFEYRRLGLCRGEVVCQGSDASSDSHSSGPKVHPDVTRKCTTAASRRGLCGLHQIDLGHGLVKGQVDHPHPEGAAAAAAGQRPG